MPSGRGHLPMRSHDGERGLCACATTRYNECLHMTVVSTAEVPSAAMTIRFVPVSVLAALFLTVNAPSWAVAVEDRFQQAVNYVFTGRVDPANGPQIVD